MPYPDKPQILTSYTAKEQALGDGSLPGQELDVDLANLQTSTDQIVDFLKLFTRSDGKLANGIVGQEALASSIRIGFDPPEGWATGRDYTTRSTVFQGFGFYLCTTAHTSSVFATDLASGRWQLLADLTPPGGALLASNNLSDLTDIPAARATLGFGSMATLNAGTASSQFRDNGQNDARFQPLDATLTAVAGLSGSADQVPYFTGADALALTTITSAGRQLIGDTSFANMRTTLGLGALATLNSITTSQVNPATLVTTAEGIAANDNDSTLPTSAAVKDYVDGRTPVFIRAAVNFSGVALTGTYSRTGSTVTVTMTAHGMTTGQACLFTVQSGAAGNNHTAIVTVIDANTFTYTDAASGTTSGNLTRRVWQRGWFNVNRVIYNGVGDYTVEFTTALPTENYVLNATLSGGSFVISVTALTTTTARVQVQNSATGAAAENGLVSIMAVI